MIGTHIKRLREAKGMTQQQLADQLNVGRTVVTMWESGENTPPTKHLAPLAATLGCTVDDLLKAETA